ncbi:helix-turn-helix transcriptional regulator [Streptomyces incanus]|uniref:LuxR C-terminal-related transcriptional regulator n=1 Tax=Streptomyces incanus TaxID=887453 RepID=A0ABW0XWL6_9ACTN
MGNLLAFLGMTEDEERVYRALLRRGSSSSVSGPNADEEPLEAGEPDRETMERLLVLGLATRANEVTRAVPPPRAVDALIDRRLQALRDELESEADRRSVIETLFLECWPAGPSARTGDVGGGQAITPLHGIEAVRGAIDELTFFARTEDLTTEPAGIITPESIAVSRPINMRLLRRGVRLRMIVGAAILQDEVTLTYMRELVSHGTEVRVSHQPIEKVIIVDRSAALTPIDPAHTALGALLVREPGLVTTLVTLFERMWGAAEELPHEDVDLPSDTEREILAMLREADKDETAARRLGMSVRTYRKHLAALMRRLDATNRVEAALIAHEKGWLN